jgi:hypothetical protein
MKLNIFFCQFPNPWTLRVSGMGGYTSKSEKKSKSLHPNVQCCFSFHPSFSSPFHHSSSVFYSMLVDEKKPPNHFIPVVLIIIAH